MALHGIAITHIRHELMQARGSPLETLVYSVLPGLSKLPPRERQERVDELVEYADDILARYLAPKDALIAAASRPQYLLARAGCPTRPGASYLPALMRCASTRSGAQLSAVYVPHHLN